MKKKLFKILSLVGLMGLGTLTACDDPSKDEPKQDDPQVETVHVESVSITPAANQTIEIGQTIQFTASVLPNDAANKNVSWSVNSATVGTINQTGLFTGVAAGNVIVTVTSVDGNKTATCNVTVKAAPTIDSVTLNPTGTSTAIVGGKINFTVNVTGTEEDKSVTWAVSDATKASITQTGEFSANAAGQVTVTATSKKDATKKDTCVVTINPAPYIQAVTINPTGTSTAIVGGKINFTVNVTGTEEDKSVTWAVSDATKATITQTGEFSANAAGQVTVTATSKKDSSKKDTCVVTINPAPYIESVAIGQGATSTVIVGGTIDFTATVTGTETDKSVVWSVSDATKASIDQQGHFSATAAGEVTVTATSSKDSTKSASCVVTINAPTIDSVTMSPTGTSSVNIGKKINFSVSVTGTETDKSVVWSVSDATKATITQTGELTALAKGEVTVTVTSTKDSTKKDTCVVTITDNYEPEGDYNSGSQWR